MGFLYEVYFRVVINLKQKNMSLLLVTAAGSPLFDDFLVVVSVTSFDGAPAVGLKPSNFKVYMLASLNHASVDQRTISKATEGPGGFYTLQLKKRVSQPKLPAGHYVLGVTVTSGKTDKGQTTATGNIP
ncbi:MAG TPA: hypothetical protein VIN08_09270 [Ohtaekwangia sp.]